MSKPRKVVRGKRIYRGRSKRPGQILRGILFALLLVVLIGIGYIVCREWVKSGVVRRKRAGGRGGGQGCDRFV